MCDSAVCESQSHQHIDGFSFLPSFFFFACYCHQKVVSTSDVIAIITLILQV